MEFNLFFFSNLVVFLNLIFAPTVAQDTNRVRKNLQILCSSKFAGRGYLKNGHLKAAGFLGSKFKKAGLKPIGPGYFQNLEFSQNLFPEEPALFLNQKAKKVGIDYLPSPGCPTVSGKFKPVWLDSMTVQNLEKLASRNFPNQAWILQVDSKTRRRLESEFSPGLWIFLESKLTHSLAQNQNKTPSLVFQKDRITTSDTILEIRLRAELKQNIMSKNVIGMVSGSQVPDSFLVVCAHFDHLGMIGKSVFFPGANDNASGTAFLLELINWYALHPSRYSLVFIAFTGEEAGLLGSTFFVENPLIPLEKIKFLLNLDLLGFGEKGATVVNATLHKEAFDRLKRINGSGKFLAEIKPRGKAANSDHFPFSEAGVPAFFLYTMGGPGYYHDVFDRPETVNLKHLPSTFSLIREFLDSF